LIFLSINRAYYSHDFPKWFFQSHIRIIEQCYYEIHRMDLLFSSIYYLHFFSKTRFTPSNTLYSHCLPYSIVIFIHLDILESFIRFILNIVDPLTLSVSPPIDKHLILVSSFRSSFVEITYPSPQSYSSWNLFKMNFEAFMFANLPYLVTDCAMSGFAIGENPVPRHPYTEFMLFFNPI